MELLECLHERAKVDRPCLLGLNGGNGNASILSSSQMVGGRKTRDGDCYNRFTIAKSGSRSPTTPRAVFQQWCSLYAVRDSSFLCTMSPRQTRLQECGTISLSISDAEHVPPKFVPLLKVLPEPHFLLSTDQVRVSTSQELEAPQACRKHRYLNQSQSSATILLAISTPPHSHSSKKLERREKSARLTTRTTS